MSEKNVQLLQDMYAAFLRGDINTILANVTEDVTWGTPTVAQEVPWYRMRNGAAGVGDFFATLDREVEFTDFSPKLFAASGDDVIVFVDIAYKLKKNGKGASTGSMHRFNVRDGKVSSFRAFEDTAGVRDAWNG
jgi:ketosteroid isomerase-like protein